ncbi:hypothetical protein NitYY0918_C1247 [Nitratiruptor sp. YY09-18]|nr:hypothetical protein NitYY0918_C1247 [Nitratiruptor sp. YY09-18]
MKFSLSPKEAYTIFYNEREHIEEMIQCGFNTKKLCRAIMRDLLELRV